jgi:hypothetical protein
MALLEGQKNYLVPTKDGQHHTPGEGSMALLEGQKNYLLPTKNSTQQISDKGSMALRRGTARRRSQASAAWLCSKDNKKLPGAYEGLCAAGTRRRQHESA